MRRCKKIKNKKYKNKKQKTMDFISDACLSCQKNLTEDELNIGINKCYNCYAIMQFNKCKCGETITGLDYINFITMNVIDCKTCTACYLNEKIAVCLCGEDVFVRDRIKSHIAQVSDIVCENCALTKPLAECDCGGQVTLIDRCASAMIGAKNKCYKCYGEKNI